MKDSNRKPRQRRSKTVEHIGTLYDSFDCQQLSKLSSYWHDKGQRARRISSLWPRPALLSCYSLGALSLALCIGNHPRIWWIGYPLSSFRQMDPEIGISWTVDFLIPSLYARIETSHTTSESVHYPKMRYRTWRWYSISVILYHSECSDSETQLLTSTWYQNHPHRQLSPGPLPTST